MRPPLAVLVLCTVLVLGGCMGFVEESRPSSDQQALDALNRTEAALDNVASYRVRSDGSATMTKDDERTAATIEGQISVNVSAREINSTGRVDESFYPTTLERRTYVTGYTAYTECKLAGWGERSLSASRPWFAYTPLGEQLAIFNRTPVYWEGTERLNGTETAVVVARPNKEELGAGPNLWTLGPDDPEGANFQNATVTMWVSTETWRPRQIHRESNWRTNGADVTLSATWQYEDYNEPTNVTRPSFDESELRTDGC